MFTRNLSMNWRGKSNPDDTTFLHQDFQPFSTPSSKINLQIRFGKENQYENWNGYTRKFGKGEKIYENQQELDEEMGELEDNPPPLPPRNHLPPSHYHPVTIEPNPNDAFTQLYDEEEEMQQSDDLSYLQAGIKKGHSRSFSALQRLSVKPFTEKHTFNKSFSGHENIYNNVDDQLSATSKSFCKKGSNPLWESFQGNVKEGKPHASKLLKISGRKLTQVAQGCRTAIASISQKFKSSTQKRYRLDASSPRHSSYSTPPHGTIRCTPSKLYAPFNCSTPPPPPRVYETKRLQPRTPRSCNRDNLRLNRSCNPDHHQSPQHRSIHSRLSLYPPHNNNTVCEAHNNTVCEAPPPSYHSHHFKRNNWASMHSQRVRRPLNEGLNGSLLPPSEENSFKRHLVEFDQMSRNLTVSFSRNNRVRSSVR